MVKNLAAILIIAGMAALPAQYLARAEGGWLLDSPDISVFKANDGGDAVPFIQPPELGVENVVPETRVEVSGEPEHQLAAWEIGSSMEREQPQYWLGDKVVPPDNVDWKATDKSWKSKYPTEEDQKYSGFLFDAATKSLYATRGGTYTFDWVKTDGSTQSVSYIFGSIASSRPLRIFWTDKPYNSPQVDLSGKFVKMFGSDEILGLESASVTNYVDGTPFVSTKVVKGLYYDENTEQLSAMGGINGQIVLAYYSTGNFDELKSVIVVEVAKPHVIELAGVIGEPLLPSGSGYNTSGLVAFPQAEDANDNRGAYYYQHSGATSYSPKNGNVYPLRPTNGESWRMPVYWMEYDPFGTLWPFELCHYDCSWSTNAIVYVRGDDGDAAGTPVFFPDVYSVELMDYQTPEGHARLSDGRNLDCSFDGMGPAEIGGEKAEGEGYALVKLSADDNVWFITVHSVERTNEAFFSQKVSDWLVGEEIRFTGADGYGAGVNPEVSAYLYAEASGDNYNPELYYDPESVSSVGIDPSQDESGSISTNKAPSVLYAVSASDDGEYIEAWWMHSVLQDGMPEAVNIPCFPQKYHAVWPGVENAPTIVIASQKGSAGCSVVNSTGDSVRMDSADSRISLPGRAWFKNSGARGGGISFWVYFDKLPEGEFRLISAEENSKSEISNFNLYVNGRADGVEAKIIYWRDAAGAEVRSSGFLSGAFSTGWNLVSVNFEADGTGLKAGVSVLPFARYREEELKYSIAHIELPVAEEFLNTFFEDTALGAGLRDAEEKVASGTVFGPISFYREPGAIGSTDMTDDSENRDPAISAMFMVQTASDGVFYADSVLGLVGAEGEVVSAWDKKVPAHRIEDMSVESGETPEIYAQNDRSKTGYNPNEEHAFVRAAGDGLYTVWALRCDLNTQETSEPGVLVHYTNADGRPAMKWYNVELSNEDFPELEADAKAGSMVPGPHPLDLFENPWLSDTYWDTDGELCPVYRDRKEQLWFRRDGTVNVYMYYPMQDGFYFPSVDASHQPDVGTPVAWLSCVVTNAFGKYEISPPSGNEVLSRTSRPYPWKWNVSWPETAPELKVGQTLTVASEGLPEVWNAKSIAVLYPQDNTVSNTAVLYDPTVVRCAKVQASDFSCTLGAVPEYFGFDTSSKGNVTLRRGKYYFKDVPPAISGRFYFDSTAGSLTNAFCLAGELEESASGASVLYVNAINAEEKTALLQLPMYEEMSDAAKASWEKIVNGLPTAPKQVSVSSFAASSGNTVSTNEIAVNYVPVDHYALTAMGGGFGYLTFIENDGTKEMGVSDGDPISMHVIKVVPEYYAGRVTAREDPENLLSQQLSILYTESFGGDASKFEFEWKKSFPTASGKVPDDYEGGYSHVFGSTPAAGLTRFVIGGQGDTLANMVNTYYVMRYRLIDQKSLSGTDLYGKWSDWCGPTLAEGWVQRVLNNVTPYTQRMQDLYENAAETLTSMIREAGPPYQGDVALNQDNLTNVGLIQLYMTVLNKAESISVNAGTNDREANKQLLQAVERLADLYMVLGNEAYADALNPTIGFGNSFSIDSPLVSLDFGNLSSSLFCFDNQVPTLLDEELALLRGRSGTDAPDTTTSPYFNRLVWNFTKGITAGEVAYAVNYNVNSTNGDAVIDEEDAAIQYPQGHGDAWGHYLSAIKGYYRLLRNPNFSWAVSMGEMLLADSVVNVDYYDEQRFAEVGSALAKTAALIVDRTARKAYAENGGASGAGYLDEDSSRGFGYAEWGTRGGIAALTTWMVANSLLPEAENNAEYSVLEFSGETTLTNSMAMLHENSLDMGRSDWTLEFQVENVLPSTLKNETDPLASILYWDADTASDGAGMSITLNKDGDVEFSVGGVSTNLPDRLTPGRSLFAVSHTREENDADEWINRYTLRLIDNNGHFYSQCHLDSAETLYGGVLIFGEEMTGEIHEIRLWNSVRSNSELQATRSVVSPNSTGLIASLRTFTDSLPGDGDVVLSDTTGTALGNDDVWVAVSPQWNHISQSGTEVEFSDGGLSRIDRTTVPALTETAQAFSSIENTVSRLDMGLNPLGFSDNSIPFDLTPIGMESGESSHFEQIAGRAKIALKNAAAILDLAQETSSQLRLLDNAQQANEDTLNKQEADYEAQLVTIYGTPYSGDIGPGKTYAQGYEGPDLINYMYMDLEEFGLSEIPDSDASSMSVLRYSVPDWALSSFIVNYVNKDSTLFSYSIRPDGLVQKPSDVTGTRSTQGEIQQAYADFLTAYREFEQALYWYDLYVSRVSDEAASAEASLVFAQVKLAANEAVNIADKVAATSRLVIQQTYDAADYAIQLATMSRSLGLDAVPQITGAGMTVNFDPSAVAAAAMLPATLPALSALYTARYTAKTSMNSADYASSWAETIKNAILMVGEFNESRTAIWDRLESFVDKQVEAADKVEQAYMKLVSARENIKVVQEKGLSLLEEREAYRARAVNKLTKMRYNDMFFRQVRDQQLERYEQAFLLAQKYVFLAAQVYDYETGLLSSDPEAGDAFRAEIVGARTIGEMNGDEPMLAGSSSAPGLSDILARLEANWLVLKPRLGINNPQTDTTWFSLRHELFRIAGGEDGDRAWRNMLASCWVDDLSSVSGFTSLCEPFGSSNTAAEPGLVIEFSSDITFAKNFFGLDLSGGDSAYDPTYFSTKIAGAGVRFDGYNLNSDGTAASPAPLSRTPSVYLVPMGADRMRVPGKDKSEVLDYNILDQVVPVPFTVGSSHLDDPDWSPTYTGSTGGADIASRIRRYPSFRAAINGSDTEDALRSTRLIGRSVWNTHWALIIPAGTLGADRESALNAFIYGSDVNNDGIAECPGVSDIKIGFRTYSHAGN